MEKNNIAVCGINCSECNIYKSAFDIKAAESLVDWFKSMGVISQNEGASELMQKGPYCDGCQGDRAKHWSPNCNILKCCSDDKKLENCSHCENFVCNDIKQWSRANDIHTTAFNYLKSLKENQINNL